MLAALGVALAGCVSWGDHREVLEERDRLEAEVARLGERVTLLEASNESLAGERVELIAQVEDLRQARESLEVSIAELEAVRADLEANLKQSQRELDARRQEVAGLRGTYDGLVSDLQAEVAAGRIEIEQLREGLRVGLSQEVLFPLGSAELGAEGVDVLRKVARRLAGVPHPIEVEGHTDDLTIRGGLAERYPSNWELGGARAARVVRLFQQEGIESTRLRAVSLGETQPLASNQEAEGRARNRRIEIRLVPLREASPPGGEVPAAAGAPAEEAAPADDGAGDS